jgi:hypothetical protein
VRLRLDVEMWRGKLGEVLIFVEDLKIICEDEESGCCVLCDRDYCELVSMYNGICFIYICIELSLIILIDK